MVRWLLLHPDKPLTQNEIVAATGVDKGYTSRLVSRLEKDAFIERSADGALRVLDPGLLLDSWRESYSFEKHAILTGHTPSRNGTELMTKLSDWLTENDQPHALTGLAAAWMYTRFAMFRLATVYLESPIDILLRLAEIGFRETARGANTWIVTPNDEGVFLGAREVEGRRCVHPLQVYLDLKEHPERAAEAADSVRERHLALAGGR